jgi:hypothetical protein
MHDEHIVSTGEEIKNGLSKCKKKKPNKQTNKQNKTNNRALCFPPSKKLTATIYSWNIVESGIKHHNPNP